MAYYKTKSNVVQAVQLVAANNEACLAFCKGKLVAVHHVGWIVQTAAAGQALVRFGDYLVKDADGQLSGMAAAEFERTYEAA